MINKLFKRKPKSEIHSAVIKSEINEHFGTNNNNPDASFFSYQANNLSFCVNHTPLDSSNSEAEHFPSLNQNFCSIFNVPNPNKVNNLIKIQ
jgi:hypothetical protein